jgi:hypothetical protein
MRFTNNSTPVISSAPEPTASFYERAQITLINTFSKISSWCDKTSDNIIDFCWCC